MPLLPQEAVMGQSETWSYDHDGDAYDPEWPVLRSPEDADTTHRWARACLEMWEQERAELLQRIAELEATLRGRSDA